MQEGDCGVGVYWLWSCIRNAHMIMFVKSEIEEGTECFNYHCSHHLCCRWSFNVDKLFLCSFLCLVLGLPRYNCTGWLGVKHQVTYLLCLVLGLPRYNCTGWLGVKHQVTYLLTIIGGSCPKYHFCRDKIFVMTNTCLLWQTCVLSWQNRSFVGTTVCLLWQT